MTSVTIPDFPSLLHENGFRATPGRLALLTLLQHESMPLSVSQIEKRIGKKMNQVTLYRTLESLVKARIVTRVYLEHDHTHYELTAGRKHHHHAVCRSCGHVEDIEVPHARTPEKEAFRRTKTFAQLDAYSLEFFGVCKKCARNTSSSA